MSACNVEYNSFIWSPSKHKHRIQITVHVYLSSVSAL